ncbi:hypothetical protein [Shewanella mangrovisoli]|uniref:hypothetical protein n=1 Tax=Shewanella mangrovisoli TaxID=2864211 RepID=UPI00313D7D2D
MFEQFTNSIKATLYDRVSSPLSSSFLVSWCLWNYKILIVLFSSMEPYQKYNAIDIFISTSLFSTPFYEPLGYLMSNGFVYPLLSALAYIFIYPIPSKYIYKYHIKQLSLLKQARNTIEELEVLTVDESLKIKKFALGQERGFIETIKIKDDEIAEKNKEIERINSRLIDKDIKINELTGQVGSLTESVSKHVDEITRFHDEVANLILENNNMKDELLALTDKLHRWEGLYSDSSSSDKSENESHKLWDKFNSVTETEVFKSIVNIAKSETSDVISKFGIYEKLGAIGLNRVSIDDAMNKLASKELISIYSGSNVGLSADGLDLAVRLKLA